MSTETTGSLLVILGFVVGAAAMFVDFGAGTRVPVSAGSIGLVVVGLVMSIAGKKR